MSEWISVKERLPEHGQITLCYDDGEMDCDQWDEWANVWVGHSQRVIRVTHWMPLPEPPKEG